MKSFALILALAVITGCNARAVRQVDVTPTRWEDAVERFWTHVSALNTKADGVVENIKASELSRELDTLIRDTMSELDAYKVDVQTKLKPYTDTSVAQMTEDLTLLFKRLNSDMVEAKERNIQYLGELKAMMEANTNDVHGRITAYTNKLRKRLEKDSREIRETVETYMGELQSRATQNLHSVKEGVQPYVEQAGDSAQKKLTDISALLRTQAAGLGQQLESQAEGFRTQLEATAEELRASLGGRIDELTDLIAPYAAKIRENIEGIVQNVKDSASN